LTYVASFYILLVREVYMPYVIAFVFGVSCGALVAFLVPAESEINPYCFISYEE
jgi:hypothetical protein